MDVTLRGISASRMYLETREPRWLRAEFSARLRLLEMPRVECAVRRVDAGEGLVVEFVDLTPEARMNLHHLIWKPARP